MRQHKLIALKVEEMMVIGWKIASAVASVLVQLHLANQSPVVVVVEAAAIPLDFQLQQYSTNLSKESIQSTLRQ